MRKLRFFIPPAVDTYGVIGNAHFEPIKKHLPKNSYEYTALTGDRIRVENAFNDPNFIRVSFTLGDFWPAIFITHGMADKGLHETRFLNKQIANFYPGPAYVNRFIQQGADPSKLKVIGCPMLDDYFERRRNAEVRPTVKVVWCPTHAPKNEAIQDFRTSYRRFSPEYLKSHGFDVVTSLHPHNQDHRSFKMSVENFYDADAVISDTSSVIYEALALGIPVIITKWLISEVYGTERDIYSRTPGNEVCWLANSQDEVLMYLNRIKAGLGQGPKAKEFMESIFPEELRGKSGKKAAETLLEYL